MKRMVPIKEDIYNEEEMQLSFYQTSEKSLTYKEEEMPINWNRLLNSLEQKEAEDLLNLLNMDETNKNSIYQAPYSIKIKFIYVATILMIRLLKKQIKDREALYYNLLETFFQKLDLLPYNSDIINNHLEQDKIGLLRSYYYKKRNELIALEIKEDYLERKRK